MCDGREAAKHGIRTAKVKDHQQFYEHAAADNGNRAAQLVETAKPGQSHAKLINHVRRAVAYARLAGLVPTVAQYEAELASQGQPQG